MISLAVEYDNQYIMNFIRVRMSPFDFILIPDKLLPDKITKIKSKKKSSDKFDKAGFKIKVGIYAFGTILV